MKPLKIYKPPDLDGSMLKQILDEYAEETISDEQIERVLAPVIRMIEAGCFNRPKPKRFHRIFSFFVQRDKNSGTVQGGGNSRKMQKP